MRKFFWIWCPLINFVGVFFNPWVPDESGESVEVHTPIGMLVGLVSIAFLFVWTKTIRRSSPEHESVTRWIEINFFAALFGGGLGGAVWSLFNGPDWVSFGSVAMVVAVCVLFCRPTIRYCYFQPDPKSGRCLEPPSDDISPAGTQA